MSPLYNEILNLAAAGDWSGADEAFARAVEQAKALGNPNPEQAIISAIRTRSPEGSVFARQLTDEERAQVYGRLTPERRAQVDRVNSVFEEINSRYGTGGAGGGGAARRAGLAPRFGSAGAGAGFAVGAAAGARAGLGAGLRLGGGLSLGLPRGVRTGFRTRSLRRGRRARSLVRGGLRRPRIGNRLRRLAV